MATTASQIPPASLPTPHRNLRVSRYEQVSATLVSFLVVTAVVTAALFSIWLSSRLTWTTPAVPVKVLEDVGGGGSGDSFTGGQRELEEPDTAELPEVTSTEQPVELSINSIASIVSAEAVTLDVVETGSSYGKGEGTGFGDGRGKGPGGPGTSDGIPAWERWEVRMSAASVEEYARQLDFFGVELGVAGGGSPTVEYISNVSAARPKVRVGLPKDEKRLRFLHRSGELREGDRQLAAKAGVNTAGRVVFQFYPQAMYDQLLRLENERMGMRRIIQVKRTVFGVRSARGRYDFYVISQEYREGV